VQGGGTNCCDTGSGVCYATTQSSCPVATVSYTTSTPVASFLDACSLPCSTRVLVGKPARTSTPPIALSFPFTFFGQATTQVWLQSQGTLGLGPPPTSPAPTSFPSCTVSNSTTAYAAAVVFGDANLATGGNGVCYATTGAAPNRTFIATWSQATDTSDLGSVLSFSVVLTETTNTVDFVYGTAMGGGGAALDSTVAGATATVGIQSYADGSHEYAAYSCAKAFLTSTPFDVQFTPN
jgi:hypothetical protein